MAKGWKSAGNGSWHTNSIWNATVYSAAVVEDVLKVGEGWRVSSGRLVNGYHRPGSPQSLTIREAREACARDPGCIAFSYERAHWLRDRTARMHTVLVGIGNGTGMLPLGVTIDKRRPESEVHHNRAPSQGPDAVLLNLSLSKPWEWLDRQLSWSTHFNPAFFSRSGATDSTSIGLAQHLWPYQEAIALLSNVVDELVRALRPWASRAASDEDFYLEFFQDMKIFFPFVDDTTTHAMVKSMIDIGMRNEAAAGGHRLQANARRRESVVTMSNAYVPEIADAICTSRAVTRKCLDHGSSALLSTTCAKKMLTDLVQAVSGAVLDGAAFQCMTGGKCPAQTSTTAKGIDYCTQLYGSADGIQTANRRSM